MLASGWKTILSFVCSLVWLILGQCPFLVIDGALVAVQSTFYSLLPLVYLYKESIAPHTPLSWTIVCLTPLQRLHWLLAHLGTYLSTVGTYSKCWSWLSRPFAVQVHPTWKIVSFCMRSMFIGISRGVPSLRPTILSLSSDDLREGVPTSPRAAAPSLWISLPWEVWPARWVFFFPTGSWKPTSLERGLRRQ